MVDEWTPEEQAIIAQAVDDLTPKDPVEVVQEAVREKVEQAMRGVLYQKDTKQLRRHLQGIVAEQLGRSLEEIKVETDPNDPTTVLVSLPIPAKFIKVEF